MASDGQKRHIHQALKFLHPEDGAVFEICGLGPSKQKSPLWEGFAGGKKAVVAGWYDDFIKATEEAAALDTVGCDGIYVTLNGVDSALLGRANNRLLAGVARTQDKEVPVLRRFLIDIDPKRPAGISSTDEEHDAALEHAEWLRNLLSSKGWPDPLYGDSGNGAHLIYLLPDLENTEENVNLIRDALNALNTLYCVAIPGSQGHIHLNIDCSVFNPARISKVYGTHARKGDDTKERPHRQAEVISAPAEQMPVSIELLKALIASVPKDEQTASGNTWAQNNGSSSGKFDLTGYLDKYGARVKAVKDHKGATLHVLETCLFDETHTGGEAAIGQTAEGKLFYQCFHDSCKSQWADARQKISGKDNLGQFVKGYKAGRSQSGAPSSTEDQGETATGKEAGKETQAQKLIQLAAEATLFHSPGDECFALVPQNEHREVLPIRTKAFKQWLTRLFYMSEEKPPQTKALQETLLLLEAKGRFDGEEHPVYVRVAEHGGNVYLDLCNPSWEAVEITRGGWRVISDPPVKFRRTRGMLPLPHPVSGGSLEELRPFLNTPDDGSFCLLCGFLVQTLNPSGPYPILNLEGEQGTGKSHTARILRSCVDPATAMLKTAPRDERDLMIAATNAWLLAFDNLSGVESWMSDALCRLATGGGFSTRELYTNDEEIIFEATRPQILTGIDRISSRHDLIDRSIVIVLPVISESFRREEKVLWREFEAARPGILGALCDAAGGALANFDKTNLDRKPRMADFAKWVTAAEPVLPWKPGAFMEAYSGNRTDAVSLALDSDVVASVVRQFMEDRGKWEGTPTDLLAALRDLAPEDVRKLKTWPKAANGLTKRLRRMATFLRATGIELDLDGKTPDSSRTRIVTVTKYVQKTVRTVQTVREDQQNLTDQDFSTQTLRTVADDTRTVSDDNADDTQIQPSDHNPALDTDSDDSDDSDGKKHTLCNDTINPDIVEYF